MVVTFGLFGDSFNATLRLSDDSFMTNKGKWQLSQKVHFLASAFVIGFKILQICTYRHGFYTQRDHK